jgi:hypothetical protein
MYSICYEGKVLDYKYKPITYGYNFYIGDIFVGQIFKMPRYWSAVSSKDCPGLNNVDGFKTKFAAAEYMLRHQGYIT